MNNFSIFAFSFKGFINQASILLTSLLIAPLVVSSKDAAAMDVECDVQNDVVCEVSDANSVMSKRANSDEILKRVVELYTRPVIAGNVQRKDSSDTNITLQTGLKRKKSDIAESVQFSDTAEKELYELQVRFADALLRSSTPEKLLAQSAQPEPVTIQWLGSGSFSTLPTLASSQPVPVDEDVAESGISEELRDGAYWMDGVSEVSGNEFRVRIPAKTMNIISVAAENEGLHLGSGIRDESAEKDALGENEVVMPLGISNGFDSRVLKGSINTAQTSSNLRKLFQVNGGRRTGCSGVLVGPKHNLTAGHCVWRWRGANRGNWSTGTLRAGRNGTAWHADASISSNRWYWVPSQYRASVSNPVAGAWDIGMFVTHASRMGEDPDVGGWFGYAYYTSNSDFEYYYKYNRGYPACGLSSPPDNCRQNHMYGDTTGCGIGGYSSSKDPWGIPRRVKHSCDTSGGMSGSPLYEYNSFLGAWVVSAIHTGYDGTGGSTPNYATRITREFANDISWLRSTFP